MRKLLSNALLLLMTPGLGFAANEYNFCYGFYPPFAFVDTRGEVSGQRVELLKRAADMSNVDIKVTLMPEKQCQRQLKLGSFDGILPLFKTPERAEYLEFSEVAVYQTSVFWFRKERFSKGVNWQHFDDLSNLKLGMLIGSYIDDEMEKALSRQRPIHRAKDVDNLFDLLARGRIDVAALNLEVGRAVLSRRSDAELFAPSEQYIQHQPAYFAISKASSAVELLPELNRALSFLAHKGLEE